MLALFDCHSRECGNPLWWTRWIPACAGMTLPLVRLKFAKIVEVNEMSVYERMMKRYAGGMVPWDDVLPPPEVMALAEKLAQGRALDLGCGYGRSSIYLAQHGWQVDGVDFVPQAIVEANARAQQAGVADQIRFYNASVTELDFLTPAYDLAVDVGCMHALDEAGLQAYAAGLRRLLRPGAQYLLYGRLRQADDDPENGPRGLPEEQIRSLFAEEFELEQMVRGETAVPDQPIWSSAWFYFRRQL